MKKISFLLASLAVGFAVGGLSGLLENVPRFPPLVRLGVFAALFVLGMLAILGLRLIEMLLERWSDRRRARARARAAMARLAQAEAALAVTDEGLAYAGQGETPAIRWDEVEEVRYEESNIFWDADPSTWWVVGARRADGSCPILLVPDDPDELTDRLLAACAAHLPEFDASAHRKAREVGVFHVPELATVTYWRRSDHGVSIIYWYHRKEDGARA